MRRSYSHQQRVEALARLVVNGGMVRRTASELGIPHPTLLLWRDAAEAGGEVLLTRSDHPVDYAALWGESLEAAVDRIYALLPRLTSAKEAAIIAGIVADRLLDFTQGRVRAPCNHATRPHAARFDDRLAGSG